MKWPDEIKVVMGPMTKTPGLYLAKVNRRKLTLLGKANPVIREADSVAVASPNIPVPAAAPSLSHFWNCHPFKLSSIQSRNRGSFPYRRIFRDVFRKLKNKVDYFPKCG